jgi:thiol-disulfide isomerase/thioredoxin
VHNKKSGEINIMIKKLFFLLLFLSVFGVSSLFAQEVEPLSNVKDIEQVLNSNKGKVVLLNFWATWCKPCVKEFPELIKLYNDYKDKGFEIVFISTDVPDDVEAKVIPFLKKQGVEFTTYYNNFNDPAELINFVDKNWEGAIPSTYIYDKKGKLTGHILGSTTYDDFEKEILKNLD